MANLFYDIAGDDFIEEELDTTTREIEEEEDEGSPLGFQIEEDEAE